MRRREFLAASAATAFGVSALGSTRWLDGATPLKFQDEPCCDRTYATVADAMKAPPETLMYVPGIYSGTDVKKPDYLATIDVDPSSSKYGQVIHRLPMPNVGDELHHFGWNTCSSCHGQEGKSRRYIVLPGITSSRIHIVDTEDAKAPKIIKVIEPIELFEKANLSAPHTVHCLADGTMVISCLGDAQGNAPGGFLVINKEFEIVGRWENDLTGMNYAF